MLTVAVPPDLLVDVPLVEVLPPPPHAAKIRAETAVREIPSRKRLLTADLLVDASVGRIYALPAYR
jgi:hypothetical protein